MGKSVKRLVVASLLIALDVVFARFFAINLPPIVRLSFQFLPNALAATFFGPIYGAFIMVAGDIIGMLVNSAGQSFFWGFTITAALKGFLYGLFFYKKSPGIIRTILGFTTVTVVCSLILNSFWYCVWTSSITMPTYIATFSSKVPADVVSIIIYSSVYFFVLTALKRCKIKV